MGDGMQQCIQHPHRTNPSGICAFCLQDKLAKLVSSSSSSSPHPFLLPNNTNTSPTIIFQRSNSTATPKTNHNHNHFTPTKRYAFWSFLNPSSSKSSVSKPRDRSSAPSSNNNNNKCVASSSSSSSSSLVSRSRSVGCGSRSFSGDFFERISSGLGDCTLRRVESQREGKPKLPHSAVNVNRCGMKERVRCGGIFGGFVMNSCSSSSSSSSWVCSSGEERKSWGWAFASPMRAFGSKGSCSKREDASSHKNATPNLSAIPSLLSVRG